MFRLQLMGKACGMHVIYTRQNKLRKLAVEILGTLPRSNNARISACISFSSNAQEVAY